jgi:hypothetical protein
MRRIAHTLLIACTLTACAQASNDEPPDAAVNAAPDAFSGTLVDATVPADVARLPDASPGTPDASSATPDAASSIDSGAPTIDAGPPADADTTPDAVPPPDAPTPPGTICSEPLDVSGASFPLTVSGTFSDDPGTAGSCDTTPNNAFYFSYTPTDTGFYEVTVQNQTTTNAYSRLTVRDGVSCAPYGDELECNTYSGKSVTLQVQMMASQPYLFIAYTDGDNYPMLDPIITITKLTSSDGEFCQIPADVTSVSFPHQLTGTFSNDPSNGTSCVSTAHNTAWFSYTAPATGWYGIDLTNATTTNAYSRVGVFDGTSCNPYGTELECSTSSSKSVSTLARFTQGKDYLVMFYTDGASYTMVDPTIDIAREAPGGGETCAAPVDISSATFPYQLTGTYHEDPATGGSCETSATNAVFYLYTAPATATVTISAQNATTTNAWSRLAVFETASCSPYGTEAACDTANGKSISVTLNAVQSTTYLIVFYTDGDQYTMVNPQITIN